MTPYIPKGFGGQTVALHRYAQENGIDILDMNLCYDEIGIDNTLDFYDTEHLNVYGAEKASAYLTEYIQDHFTLTPRNVDDASLWQEDLKVYHSQFGE